MKSFFSRQLRRLVSVSMIFWTPWICICNILEESINPCLLLLFQGGNWWQDVFLERKAKVPEKERKYRICGHFSGENKEYMSAVGTFSAKPIHLLHYCLRGDSLDQVASQQIAINDFLHPPPYITIVNIHKEILNIGKQYNYQYWPKRSIVLTEIYPKNVKTICSGHKTFTTPQYNYRFTKNLFRNWLCKQYVHSVHSSLVLLKCYISGKC